VTTSKEGIVTMKKTISALIILLMFLVPVGGGASYLIRLKNGGQLSTPMYWAEGKWILFPCVGGTAGMEGKEIDRIERDEREDDRGSGRENIEMGKAPPTPSTTEKPKEPTNTPQAKETEEKINIEAYKNEKDRMTAELDDLLEKMRESTGRKDEAARKEAMEEIVTKSTQIYKLTDEVTKKNKGKLPDGWWEKK
jgi:hypothetical protein